MSTQHRIVLATSPFLRDFQRYDPTITVFNPPDVKGIDGVIFSGGADISPTIYNEDNTFSWPDERRDKTEIAVYHWAKQNNKRMFGVCRGHQLLNALEGGKLIQDLSHPGAHRVKWLLSDMSGYFPHGVNSMHHQGYTPKLIAPSLRVSAVEPATNIVEAAEGSDIKTVQFHPEFMGESTIEFFQFIFKWLRGE